LGLLGTELRKILSCPVSWIGEHRDTTVIILIANATAWFAKISALKNIILLAEFPEPRIEGDEYRRDVYALHEGFSSRVEILVAHASRLIGSKKLILHFRRLSRIIEAALSVV